MPNIDAHSRYEIERAENGMEAPMPETLTPADVELFVAQARKRNERGEHSQGDLVVLALVAAHEETKRWLEDVYRLWELDRLASQPGAKEE